MNLVQTSALNGLGVATRIGAALLLNKVLAIHLGPTGYGVVGQFQSVLALIVALVGGALSSGLTKYTAEHSIDPARRDAMWRTALAMSACGVTLASALLLLLAPTLASTLLADSRLVGVFLLLAVLTPLLAANAIILAILSGLKKVHAFVGANVVGSLLGTAFAVAVVSHWGLVGALAASAASQAIAGVVAVVFFWRSCPGHLSQLFGPPDRASAKALSGYVLMAATTATIVPAAHIAIREGVSSILGPSAAGLWQAMSKLSEMHLLLLTTTLSLYFLPRYSEIKDGPELLREVRRGYRFVLGIVCSTSAAIFLLKDPLISALFSKEFSPIADALAWQLVGDTLKVGSWVAAFTMISHARVGLFIATECAFGILLAALTLAGTEAWGLHGAAAGYALTYAIYWIVVHLQLNRLARNLTRPASPT